MGEVNVQFLGSGDAFRSGGRLLTCIYVKAEESHFLLTQKGVSMPLWAFFVFQRHRLLAWLNYWGIRHLVVDQSGRGAGLVETGRFK